MRYDQFEKMSFQKAFAERSVSGAVGFMTSVTVLFLAALLSKAWGVFVLPLSILIFISNWARWNVAKSYLRRESVTTFRWLQAFAMINTVLWFFALAPSYLLSGFSGLTALTALLMAAGYAAGGTVTLASSLTVWLIFQLGMIGPVIVGSAYFWWASGDIDYLTISGVSLAFFVFNGLGVRNIRRTMTTIFRQEYDLMRAQAELEKTKQELAYEQVKLIHSSRLASLGEMAGGLAHEINNPLAILMLGLESVEQMMTKSPDDKTGHEMRLARMQTMKKAVLRISKIIRGLRHFSQQGESLPFEQISARSIIDETLEFFSERIKKSEAQLRVEGDLDLRIRARPVQASQVLLNLLSNSLEAMSLSERKEILVEVREENDRLLITVTDSGPGLPPEVKGRLFQPFVTSKEPGQGMGLGLSISKGIMKEHQGDLVYLSDCPRTTFQMEFPRMG